MPLPVSLLVLLHSLFPKLARPGGLNLMATYLQNTGRRSHSKGWADQPNVSHSLNVHLLPHRIHGTIVYWPTWTVDFLWSIRRYIYQSHESYGYLCEKNSCQMFFFRPYLIRALPSVWGQPSTVGPSRAFFPLPVLESPHASNIIWAMKKNSCKKADEILPSYGWDYVTNHETSIPDAY